MALDYIIKTNGCSIFLSAIYLTTYLRMSLRKKRSCIQMRYAISKKKYGIIPVATGYINMLQRKNNLL